MSEQPFKPLKAVVVNDDPTQLKVLCGLVRKAGLEPLPFDGAEEALAALDPDDPPDLIVTDLYMPGVDGWRFCRLLRSPEYLFCNKVPILVVSATFSGDYPERVTTDTGADAFLSSPVDGKAVVAQVKALLRGGEVRHPPRALIVENDKALAGLIRKTFLAHGWEADTALTAHEAEEAFARTDYEMAVLEHQLPDSLGDVLLDGLRARRPDCVCVMTTSDPKPEMALDWMKRGAAACLRKPFEPESLMELCDRTRRERTLLRAAELLKERTRELRESEERYRSLFNQSPNGIFLHDLDGRILDVNEAACAQTGHSGDELLRLTVFDLHPAAPNTPNLPRQEILRRWRQWQPDERYTFQGEHVRKDGTTFPVEISTGPIRIAGRTLILAIVLDITERKRAEDKTHETYQLLTTALNSVKAVIYVADMQTHELLFVNELGRDFFGDITGRLCWEVLQEGQDGPCTFCTNDRLLREDGEPAGVYQWEFQNTLTGRWYDCRDAAVRWTDGRLVRIEVATDITERKKAEEEREKLQAQLNQAQKMESVGRLAGGVAHDFNNMLGVILGHAELALEGVGPNEPLHADLIEIQKAAERSSDLTRQLLAFARKQTVAPRVLDLNETVEGMLKMLRRILGEDIHLTWLPGTGLGPVCLDPSQLDQILANLCVNARDAIAGTGKLVIETRNVSLDEEYCAHHAGAVPGDYVLLAVSDDGCGMDAETLSNVFEPFFTTKEAGRGTGLGLATVYGAVKQNNGYITIYSEPGQGTTVKILLPRHGVRVPPRPEKAEPRAATAGGETILLVEDETAMLNMTTAMLERLGYAVIAARTPGEAIRLAREHAGSIDLVLTDVVMPEMNGRDLARNLLSIYPNLNCLFMSGYTADVIAHRAVLDEGVHFLQKPYSMNSLAVKIREALGLPPRAALIS